MNSAQATLAESNASELSDDDVRSEGQTVGYRLAEDGNSAISLNLEELAPGDQLALPESLMGLREGLLRLGKSRLETFFLSSLLGFAFLGIGCLIASLVLGILLGPSPIVAISLVSSLGSTALMCAMACSYGPLVGRLRKKHLGHLKVITMPKMERIAGTPYDLETPSYEEFCEAVQLISQAHVDNDALGKVSGRLEELRSLRKTPAVTKERSELESKKLNLESNIASLEEQARELLSRRSMEES